MGVTADDFNGKLAGVMNASYTDVDTDDAGGRGSETQADAPGDNGEIERGPASSRIRSNCDQENVVGRSIPAGEEVSSNEKVPLRVDVNAAELAAASAVAGCQPVSPPSSDNPVSPPSPPSANCDTNDTNDGIMADAQRAAATISPPLAEGGAEGHLSETKSSVARPSATASAQPAILVAPSVPILPKSHLTNAEVIALRDPPRKGAPSSKKKNQKSLATSKNCVASSSSAGDNLRRGKWTPEEEDYVTRVIQDFNSGVLKAPAGTTLRSYLSEKLNCDPMRITKKFTGEACIGKRVFHPAVRTSSNAAAIDKAQAELEELEEKWRKRIEIQQRESAKKAAASAAAAAATGGNGGDPRGSEMSEEQLKRNIVAKTALWLDRAGALLSGNYVSPENLVVAPPKIDDIELLPPSLVEFQMKEVEKLLNEGSIIQKVGKGLPRLLEGSTHLNLTAGKEAPSKRSRQPLSGGSLSTIGPQAPGGRPDAEGAQALVGFIESVRSSANTRGETEAELDMEQP